MGHALMPRNGQSLSATDVAKRLKATFAHVDVDFDAGRRAAIAQADQIERTPAAMFLGQHTRALQYARELRAVVSDGAAVIAFGDASEQSLRIMVLPGETIKFGYGSKEEENRNRDLVLRCASALDSDVVEF